MKFPIGQLQAYNNAEISIHRICQLISLTGVNLAVHKSDDSHTNMAWEPENDCISGRFFELSNQQLRLIFLLSERVLKFENNEGKLVSSIFMDYADYETLVTWWRMQLQELGFKDDLIDQVHYDLPTTPQYKSTNIGEFSAFVDVWKTLRTQANHVFEQLNQKTELTSEIRIWPHHFDTGVYYELNKVGTQAIGAGLAIADILQPEPYYYIYGWKKDKEIDFCNAPILTTGNWFTQDWKGAILPVSAINNLEEINQVGLFLNEAFEFLVSEIRP